MKKRVNFPLYYWDEKEANRRPPSLEDFKRGIRITFAGYGNQANPPGVLGSLFPDDELLNDRSVFEEMAEGTIRPDDDFFMKWAYRIDSVDRVRWAEMQGWCRAWGMDVFAFYDIFVEALKEVVAEEVEDAKRILEWKKRAARKRARQKAEVATFPDNRNFEATVHDLRAEAEEEYWAERWWGED